MPGWVRMPQFIHAFLAALLVAAGVGALYLLGQVQTLRCSRVEGGELVDCRMITSWMKRTVLEDTPLAPIHRALVEESCDSDSCTYRVLLETDRASIPLSGIYTSNRLEQEGIARRINQYLDAPASTPLEVETGGGLILLVPLMFFSAGGYLAVKAVRELLQPAEG